MVGEVHLDGEQHGYHWWNRLSSGVEIDLTREQFRDGQVITLVRQVQRPAEQPTRRREEYIVLRERLTARLGPLPPPAGSRLVSKDDPGEGAGVETKSR